MSKTLYIMRGLPGSIRDEISSDLSSGLKLAELSALNFFVDKKLPYDYHLLPEAYKYCWESFKDLVHQNIDIVLNNTNGKSKHYSSYVSYGAGHGYRVVIVTVPIPDPKRAAEKCKVPEETIRRMMLEWED